MDEFYRAKEDETPVVIIFPTVSKFNNERTHAMQTRPHYFGTFLSNAEITEILEGIDFVDRSSEPMNSRVLSCSLETGQPLNPGVHEFAIDEADDWGFCTNSLRTRVKICLYFNGWDLYHHECPTGSDCDGDCEYKHASGWDFEDFIVGKLSLFCDERGRKKFEAPKKNKKRKGQK